MLLEPCLLGFCQVSEQIAIPWCPQVPQMRSNGSILAVMAGPDPFIKIKSDRLGLNYSASDGETALVRTHH